MKKITSNITILTLTLFLSQQLVRADDIGLYVKNVSADSVDNVLLVDKSWQRLLVIKSTAPKSVTAIDTYRITTGRVGGNKEKEGDLKTPEGIYRIISSIPGETLPPKYGPIAFVLDYPNRVDKLQKHNGSNIWIHGRDEEIVDRQTEGCVSLENSKLLELSNYITLQKTPVIIIDSLYHNGQALSENHKFYITDTLISKWQESWNNGNIDALGQLLSDQFQTRSYSSKHSFLSSKKYLETIYAWKNIEIDNLWFLQSDHEARIYFQQDYLCPKFFSRGNKELYLIWNGSTWLIIGEDFTATLPRINVSDAVDTFLKKWKNDWQDRDYEQFINRYDSTFTAKKYSSITEWSKYKKRVLAQSTKITVEIDEISISGNRAFQWNIRFKQNYSSGNYKDTGIKTLIITGHPLEPENFKIINEEWEPLN